MALARRRRAGYRVLMLSRRTGRALRWGSLWASIGGMALSGVMRPGAGIWVAVAIFAALAIVMMALEMFAERRIASGRRASGSPPVR